MPLFGPTWKKFGSRRTRECTPEFRFEGKGFFFKTLDKSVWLTTKSVAFIQLHGEHHVLDDWDVAVGNYRHTKCLSTMFLEFIQIRLTQNSLGHALEFGLYENKKRIKKIHTFEADTFGPFFTSPPNPTLAPIRLAFDRDYAWGFQTEDHTGPTFNDGNVTLSCTISCLVQMGAGDP